MVRSFMIAAASAALVFLMLSPTAFAQQGQSAAVAEATGAQAQDMSKYPDWSGQWKTVVSPTSQFAFGFNWDPDKGPGLAQQAPLTPEYQARYEANLADQAAGGQGEERHSYCIPLGMPRVMTVVYPMEIVITPKTTYILTDNSEPRRIFTDGREWPKEIEPSFNGPFSGEMGRSGRQRPLCHA